MEASKDSIYSLFPDTCYRLERWTEYNRDPFNLGYPKMSVEQMAVEGGGIDTRGSGLRVNEMPEEVALTDAAMLELKRTYPHFFKTIEIYFKQGSITAVFQKVKPKYRNRHKAREGLNTAVGMICSWISAKTS